SRKDPTGHCSMPLLASQRAASSRISTMASRSSGFACTNRSSVLLSTALRPSIALASLGPRSPDEIPQNERRRAPIRPPRFCPGLRRGRTGWRLATVEELDAEPQPEVVTRKHIWPAQMEEEKHLRRPHPDAGQRDQAGNNLFVRQRFEIGEIAAHRRLGEGEHVARLGAREPGREQLLRRAAQHGFRAPLTP